MMINVTLEYNGFDKPFTMKEFKELVASMPEQDQYGRDYMISIIARRYKGGYGLDVWPILECDEAILDYMPSKEMRDEP